MGDTEQRLPDVTVVIPCRNEGKFIDECLSSVTAQDYGAVVEILVVDGMSEDRTREKVLTWATRDRRIRLLDNPDRVVPHALNLAIKQAAGEIIVRMDAHSIFPSDYIRRCVEGVRRHRAWNYGGRVVNLSRQRTPVSRAVAAVTNHPCGVGNARFRYANKVCVADTVPFGCFPRWVFNKVGLFDERLVRNQDNELNARIVRAGGTILLDPTVEIGYYNQQTLRGLMRQAWWTGSWNTITHALCPHAFRWRHALPGVFALGVLTLVVAAATALLTGRAAPLWLVGTAFVPYAAAMVWMAATLAPRKGLLVAALAPVVAFIYHLVYGLGYLWGAVLLLTGWHRKRIPPARKERLAVECGSHSGNS